MKCTVRRLERKYRHTCQQNDHSEWIVKLKEQAALHRTKDQSYWLIRISSNSSSYRKLWKDLDILMRKSDYSSCPTSDDAKQATDFLEFFVEKIDLIRETTNGAPPPIFTDYVGPTMKTFRPTTTEQLTKMIADAPNEHCLLDPAPTSLVKNCSSLLAPFLFKLFNHSLSESYVPTSQKAAIITPLLKKMGLDKNDRKNYRPVSNLTFISKLQECCI